FVQLVEPRDQEVRWSATFDASPSGLSRSENQLATEIAQRLDLEPARGTGVAGPKNPAAHQAYLQGLYSMNLRRAGDAAAACEAFRRATTLEPRYAAAHAMLGRCFVLRAVLE